MGGVAGRCHLCCCGGWGTGGHRTDGLDSICPTSAARRAPRLLSVPPPPRPHRASEKRRTECGGRGEPGGLASSLPPSGPRPDRRFSRSSPLSSVRSRSARRGRSRPRPLSSPSLLTQSSPSRVSPWPGGRGACAAQRRPGPARPVPSKQQQPQRAVTAGPAEAVLSSVSATGLNIADSSRRVGLPCLPCEPCAPKSIGSWFSAVCGASPSQSHRIASQHVELCCGGPLAMEKVYLSALLLVSVLSAGGGLVEVRKVQLSALGDTRQAMCVNAAGTSVCGVAPQAARSARSRSAMPEPGRGPAGSEAAVMSWRRQEHPFWLRLRRPTAGGGRGGPFSGGAWAGRVGQTGGPMMCWVLQRALDGAVRPAWNSVPLHDVQWRVTVRLQNAPGVVRREHQVLLTARREYGSDLAPKLLKTEAPCFRVGVIQGLRGSIGHYGLWGPACVGMRAVGDASALATLSQCRQAATALPAEPSSRRQGEGQRRWHGGTGEGDFQGLWPLLNPRGRGRTQNRQVRAGPGRPGPGGGGRFHSISHLAVEGA